MPNSAFSKYEEPPTPESGSSLRINRAPLHSGQIPLSEVDAANLNNSPKNLAIVPKRIDTHAHVFHRGLPMLEGRRYTPSYDATLQNYLDELDRNNMTHGILVQPSFLGEDNSFMLESIASASGRLRGIAVVGPSLTAQDISKLVDCGVIGVRINLIGQRIPNLNTPQWSAILSDLITAGMFIEVYGRSTALAILVPLLLAKGANVILDHVAMPDPTLGVYDPHFEDILDLASSRKVWCKLSAPYRSGPQGFSNAVEAYPILALAFGTERILWGSDWPHTQHESTQYYPQTVKFLETLVPNSTERDQILGNLGDFF